MTKEEIQEQIKAMEESLETLKSQLKQLEDSEPKFKEKWRPEKRDLYKAIESTGIGYLKQWQGDSCDSSRKSFNNVFPPDWDLTDIIQKVKETLFFAECAKRLNPEGWKPDWSNGETSKWYISYNYEVEVFNVVCAWIVEDIGVTYFATKEVALQAIKEAEEAGLR